VYFDPLKPKCNPPPVSSSDEFKDPFSEDTGGGLLEIDGGKNIQDAKVAKERKEDLSRKKRLKNGAKIETI
jgi:hypothetical protein